MRMITALFGTALLAAGLSAPQASAKDLHINFNKHTEPTPVQKLNQDGVKEIQKHHLEKAERLFYRAYLIDPDDPFTLNNLGYISELQGKVQRAESYYQLAAKENNSETVIAESTDRKLRGEKLSQVTGAYSGLDLQVNRGNVYAMSLMQQGRYQEAEDVLRQTLKLSPKNPFTLNNLGFAMEAQGNLEAALQYYNDASITHSTEPVVVAIDSHWRGRPISDIAFRNEQAVRDRLQSERTAQERADRLSVEGVAALNHNEPDKALDYFRRAYQLAPADAFALNNMGYVSEAEGDEETAADFYDHARHADESGTPVSIASRNEMVGEAVAEVAGSNSEAADADLQSQAAAKRRKGAPIVLRRRDNKPIEGPATTPQNRNVPRPPIDNAPVENNVPRPPQ